ncbi:adenosylmethionine--8-amino-7-oxononanoate transaminase [Suttonella sp. R2A3]|uniref:adenosylmethionine--8-amino-7-oxononanoate transaminase n=1 Tax=Suttonella sp. R2A3 TaxID=2908648 RepID=UPI001F2B9057|nr:adenosylmethionine--8-amino-7-oxononanoate transaminase [Suttonella sp. R2A3]UJF24911.1 adenosylmethionine--8-amino-7-oxononanoate transaminase [Suttonella sp. R2A3]
MSTPLQVFDQAHIWHPYSSPTPALPPYEVTAAKGVILDLADGRQLIDGMSSWWSVIHGYQHPDINAAMCAQIERFAHVMFGGLTHEPAVRLSQRLLSIVPSSLAHVFYCDSGSVAVEVAMKMALQYQHARGETQRRQCATILGGYHGDTWHPMSVCDPQTGMHHLYHDRLMTQHFLPRPRSRFDDAQCCDEDKNALNDFFVAHGERIAAFILEPIVQGAGGMWFYHPDYLRHLATCCKAYGVLLVADEIATGFGRTGQWFAVNHADITPDIMCLGKALTGGYISFAATLCTTEVAHTIASGDPGVLMHGPTFMANPLACATADASLQLLQQGTWQAQVQTIAAHFNDTLLPLRTRDYIADVRVLGAIGVIELHDAVNMAHIVPRLVAAGIWVRPFGRLVYLMPPFVISAAQLTDLTDALIGVLDGLYA